MNKKFLRKSRTASIAMLLCGLWVDSQAAHAVLGTGVAAIDDFIGSPSIQHTLDWGLAELRKNYTTGCWSGPVYVRDIPILRDHVDGNGMARLRERVMGIRARLAGQPARISTTLAALDEIMGNPGDQHSLAWIITQNEKNVASGGVWHGHANLRDDIFPTHVLGNGLYKLRERIQGLKSAILPEAFDYSGRILDLNIAQTVFDDMVRQRTRPEVVATRTVIIPKEAPVEVHDEFVREKKMRESVSLTLESVREQVIERLSRIQVTTDSKTHLAGNAGASLFGLISIGGSAEHTSSKKTDSINETKTREARQTREGKTIQISSESMYRIRNTLIAKPGTRVKQEWILNVLTDFSVPFEAKLLVQARRKSDNAECNADEIRELLMYEGARNEDISPGPNATSVLHRVRGRMNASLGLDSENRVSLLE